MEEKKGRRQRRRRKQDVELRQITEQTDDQSGTVRELKASVLFVMNKHVPASLT